MEAYLTKTVGLAPTDVNTGKALIYPDQAEGDHGPRQEGRALSLPQTGGLRPGTHPFGDAADAGGPLAGYPPRREDA